MGIFYISWIALYAQLDSLPPPFWIKATVWLGKAPSPPTQLLRSLCKVSGSKGIGLLTIEVECLLAIVAECRCLCLNHRDEGGPICTHSAQSSLRHPFRSPGCTRNESPLVGWSLGDRAIGRLRGICTPNTFVFVCVPQTHSVVWVLDSLRPKSHCN